MTTYNVMLAKEYKNQNIDDWLMSEKLDGVRAYWTGTELLSRNNKKFYAPEWFTKDLPKGIKLDGELYQGRGQFQQTCGIVRRHDDQWKGVIFMIFDYIDTGFDFYRRLDNLKQMKDSNYLPYHCKIVDHLHCKDKNHLKEFQDIIENLGGEGVMIKNPNSLYQFKRSSDCLKVKSFKQDECILTGYQDGSGKHTGRVGAFLCKWNDHDIKLGTGLNDSVRDNPPEIGTTLIFNYFELTEKGVPRFPSFIGVRDYE